MVAAAEAVDSHVPQTARSNPGDMASDTSPEEAEAGTALVEKDPCLGDQSPQKQMDMA